MAATKSLMKMTASGKSSVVPGSFHRHSRPVRKSKNQILMKKYIFFTLSICAALFACQKNEIAVLTAEAPVLYATIEEADATKTYMDANNNIRWSECDKVVAFMKTSLGLEYQIQDEYLGKTFGYFSKVSSSSSNALGAGVELDHNVVYYPYSSTVVCEKSGSDYVFNAVLPAEQTYAPESFGQGAFPMVAVSEDTDFTFKNVCGAMKLQLKGNQKVTSIKLQGKNNEKLSGAAVVTAYTDGETKPDITMVSEASTIVTLNCGEGVQLTENVVTEFVISLPPVVFTKGFTVTVTDADAKVQTIETDNQNTVVRSSILIMPEIEVVTVMPEVPHNQIWYTTNDGKAAGPAYGNKLESLIVSNDYVDGRGVITFSEEITSLPYGSFAHSKNITSVHFPETLVDIGPYAFEECENLQKVIIPGEVHSVFGNSFIDCPSLRRFIGPSASEDGRCLIYQGYVNVLVAFASNGLTEYTFPEGINQLTEYACCGHSNLKKIILPESVNHIRDYAFSGCTSLQTVVLSSRITSLFNSVFSGCTSLTSIENTENITSLSYYIFGDCTSLERVEFPNLRYVSDNPFYGCTSLSEVISPLTSEDGRCLIDEDGKLVTFIQKGISEYTIPAGVTSIGWGAFIACENLQYLTTPDTVVEIDGSVFEECMSLENIKLSSNLEKIGSFAFNGCNQLKHITLPVGLKHIGHCAFQGCDNLKFMISYATTPPDLADPEYQDWSGLENLSPEMITILVPELSLQAYKSATHWSKFADVIYAFEDRRLLYRTTDESIIMPPSIEPYVLLNTYGSDGGLMIMDEYFTNLGSNAFNDIDNLLSIVIPDCVKEMENSSISDCNSLEYIKFGNGLNEIKGVESCDGLKEIRFSPCNKVIGPYAFTYLDGLEEIEIPDHIESIGEWAFQGCQNLKKVTIGTGLTTLEHEAFFQCSNLDSVHIKATTPPSVTLDYWGTWHAFYECDNITIYVPETSVDMYKSAEGWSNYQDRIVGFDFNE